MKNRILLLTFFLCTIFFLHAQNRNPISLNLNITAFSDNFYHTLCADNGVCIFYATTSMYPDTNKWSITHYDTNLAKQNQTSLILPTNHEVKSSFYTSDTLYVLFQIMSKKKATSDGLLLTYCISKNTFDTEKVSSLPTDDISNFVAYDRHVFFTSHHDSKHEDLYYYSMGTKYVQSLFLKDAPPYTIEYFSIDTTNQHLVTCLNVMPSNRANVFCICETDMAGNLLHAVDFPDTGNYIFEAARLCRTNAQNYLIIGSFQSRTTGTKDLFYGSYSMLYHDGILSAPIFSSFSKAVNRETSSSQSAETQLLVGNVFHDSTRYSLVTESFRAEYQYNTVYNFGVASLEPVFVGYRSLNAYVCTFDSLGTPVWNYTVPLDNILSRNLSTYLRIAFLPENTLFYYLHGNNMVTLLLNDKTEIIDPIRSTPLNNSTSSWSSMQIRPWYDNNYLLTGYKQQRGSAKQNYFCLSKMQYQ